MTNPYGPGEPSRPPQPPDDDPPTARLADLAGAPEAVLDEEWPAAAGPGAIETYVYDEAKPREKEHVRQAYLRAGDVIGLVVQSRPDEVAETPFRQTVILQSQLLG